jgi:hypothetical protein
MRSIARSLQALEAQLVQCALECFNGFIESQGPLTGALRGGVNHTTVG